MLSVNADAPNPKRPSVALVTGGTDGIGKATARLLVERGWEVALTARSATKGDAVAAELAAATGRPPPRVLVGDLARMADVRAVGAAFRAAYDRLDFLFLNANGIANTPTLTADGFEHNLAIGYLGRVLLLRGLSDRLAATTGSQTLSVVGLNLARLDLDDLPMAKGFSSMRALGRWQWAMQLYAREHVRRGGPALDSFMPGLVKTKILANEPQPMRAIVKLANLVMGLPVERSALEVLTTLELARADGVSGQYFARTKPKGVRPLKDERGDAERLWEVTERLLAPWLEEKAP